MPYHPAPPTTNFEWAQISKTAFNLPSIMPVNSSTSFSVSNSDFSKKELAKVKWDSNSQLHNVKTNKSSDFPIYQIWR